VGANTSLSVVGTTEEEIDAILEQEKLLPPEPTLLEAEYLRHRDRFLLTISDGRRLAIPREDIWAVRNASADQAADFTIGPNRVNIWWPQVDEGLYLPEALEGRYGNEAWMDHVHRRTSVAAYPLSTSAK
jgi:hypothetical protein